jgi:hypothetical protein
MTLSNLERVERLLPGNGRQIHPFDWVNLPIFYDPKPEENTEYTERLRAATKMAFVAANEASGGLEGSFVFRPSSMSNGYLAYKLAEDYAPKIKQNTMARFGESFLTTQNLKRHVASSELQSKVLFPNREEDFRAANKLEARMKDNAVIVPIEFENVPRTQNSSNALAQGASFQDWTFECWWVPRLIDTVHHVQGGGRTYSRYANVEDMTADLIQCGLLDEFRKSPGKTYDVTDENGTHITLADRAWERARHIVDVTERGFRTDLAVGVLLAQFQLDDWLRSGNGPIDGAKVHPTLAKRSKAELKQMDKLKAMMLPYIAQNALGWADYKDDPNLKAYIETNVEPYVGLDVDLKKIQKALWAHEPVASFQNPDFAKPKTSAELSTRFGASASSLPISQKATKRRSTEGGYFTRPAALFDDRHFDKLSIWEQAALPFILGAMESFRLPENAPNAMFYIAEPKGGALAREYTKKKKIAWLKEAYAAEEQTGKEGGFAKKVIAKNVKAMDKDIEALRNDEAFKARGGKNIVSSLNFINITQAAESLRVFVAAKGAQRLSPRARLALMTEWLDRNPQSVALRKDWSLHHDEVQLATRAMMVAFGLVDRPIIGGDNSMELFEFNASAKESKLVKMDFADVFLTMGQEVKRLAGDKAPVPSREHYLSMARMIQMLDMYSDPLGMNFETRTDPKTGAASKHEIIEWKNVDPVLMEFMTQDPAKRAAVMEMRDEAREMLLQTGVLTFDENDLDGLHEDFAAAWREAQGLDENSKRRRFDDRRTIQKWNGPV